MSAFIVSEYQINALVSYGVMKSAQYWLAKDCRWVYFKLETAQEIAAMLYSENVRSVNYRYGERTRRTGFQYKWVNVLSIQPADIVKACDCLDYQSCETKNWKRTQAYQALQAIREEAIRALTAGSNVWTLNEPVKVAA